MYLFSPVVRFDGTDHFYVSPPGYGGKYFMLTRKHSDGYRFICASPGYDRGKSWALKFVG